MTDDYSVLIEEANQRAKELFGDDRKKCAAFSQQVQDIYLGAEGKDFLLIHNPGGWGTTHLENLLQWERSIVEGVSATIDKLGCTQFLMQYFRSGRGWREIIADVREQYRFFQVKARIMAAVLDLITRHLDSIRVVIIGVSQGAAFTNAVTQYLDGLGRVFTIELGTPFPYKSHRVTTERTLSLDGNGLMPDALMEWDVSTILKTYLTAPFRWLKYKLQGKGVKFTYCINLPGHDYNWDYPEVQRQIEDFLNRHFSRKSNAVKKSNAEVEVL